MEFESLVAAIQNAPSGKIERIQAARDYLGLFQVQEAAHPRP